MDAIPITEFSDRRYLTYPHSNGWVDDGAGLILAGRGETTTTFVRHDVESGRATVLAELSHARHDGRCVYFDVANGVLACLTELTIYVLDLRVAGAAPRALFTFPAGSKYCELISLHPDGTRVLSHGLIDGLHRCWEICVRDGSREELWASEWYANHFHYVPHDPDWIAFSHEGPAPTIADRPWIFRRGAAAEARCVMDQRDWPAERRLHVGHELWAHHALTGLAVAYVASPGRPRGLYSIFSDGSPARLVSEGDRDWHVNISRDGTRAVTDTSAPLDRPEIEFSPADAGSDIVLVDLKTGARRILARTLSSPYHPAHPHPTFSPDGKWVYFNQSEPGHARHRVCRVRVD